MANGRKDEMDRKRGSGGKQVYEILRDEILEVALPPGSPLDEVQLAERFSMSRTPVREALQRLSAEGLVESLPNRSTRVAHIDFLNLPPFFDALVLMYRVTTRLAASQHREGDLTTILAHQAEFSRAVAERDASGMIVANREFHAAVANAGRNPYYAALCCRLLDEARRILRLYYRSFDDGTSDHYVEEHEMMVAAIAARDVARADTLAAAHADRIVRQIQQLFARDGEAVISL